MTHFGEVLDGVRLVLTSASPAEIGALLKGLVMEGIISEAYSQSLSLHRPVEGIRPKRIRNKLVCKPGYDEVNSQRATNQNVSQVGKSGLLETGQCDTGDLSWTWLESMLLDEQNSTESWTKVHQHQLSDGNDLKRILQLRGDLATDEHYLNCSMRSSPMICDIQCTVRIDEDLPELLRNAESMQKPVSDSESTDEGNSEDGKEWLEQVEEAARRIAVPLWQHWDRGRSMLLPLVPHTTAGHVTSESTATAYGAVSKMQEETQHAVACRTLDWYTGNYREVDTIFAEDLSFSTDGSAVMTGLTADHFTGLACTATDTNNNIADRLEDHVGETDTTDDLLRLAADPQCGTHTGFIDAVADFLSPCTLKDSFYSNTQHCMMPGIANNLANVSKTASILCSHDDIADFLESKEDGLRVDSHWGAKMQEVDHDPFLPSEYGDLPEDLTEFMNDSYLFEEEALFGDSLFSYEEFSNFDDISISLELPTIDSHQLRQNNKLTSNTNKRRKQQRVSRSQQCNDEHTPSKAKRHRAAGQQRAEVAQAEPVVNQSTGTDTGSEPSPVKTACISTPQRILHVHPRIQFITIPDTSGWLSSPVIGLPFPSTATAPTYILVPASPPPYKSQVPPLSPEDGAVAPVQMSSSPQGSDTHNKAMSPPCNSPLSPINESSPCKDPPLPQSPTVIDIPQAVKDYIQEAKAYVSQTFQNSEEALNLASHYVDMQVSLRESLHSGKHTNKCLNKELVIMGDTDRQTSLMRRSQIFEGSNGDKPKCYKLLFGNAGMGKTTLIRKLCLDWSSGCIPQFDFVFLLDGKALTLTEPAYSLQTLLLNLSSFAPPCMDADAVYAQIIAAPKRVLIIFDGFDELRDYEILLQNQEKELILSLQKGSKAQTYTVRQLYSAILQRILLSGCTLLLSTRPRGNASQLLRRADSFLEVCGFTPRDIETYFSQYFSDPDLRRSALDSLKNCSYLHLLCWNPGLCRLVCLVLEQSRASEIVSRTLTGLCHQAIRLKIVNSCGSLHTQAEDQTQTSAQSVKEIKTQIPSNIQMQSDKKTRTKSRAKVHTRSSTQRAKEAKEQEKEENEVDGKEMKSVGWGAEETELLLQLSSLAWEGIKSNSSIISAKSISAKLKAFGHRIGLFISQSLRTRPVVSNGEWEGGEREEKDEMGSGEKVEDRADTENTGPSDDHVLLWAHPFLRSFLAGAHLSLSRTVSDRNFLQTLPFQSGSKGRRRPQGEEYELTQQFAVGLLFHNRIELPRLPSYTETAFRDMLASKQALVTKHLEGLCYNDLSPAQVLQVCHYVYEASFTRGEDKKDSGGTRLVTHLAANLPEVLTFHGVPLNPPDVFTVQTVLERGGIEGRHFSLDLEDSGIHVSGLRALVGLNNINTYRACIADVIALWEQLEQSGEEGLLQGAVSKFKIHPLKATQVCHIEHLAKLVKIHTHRRLSDSSGQSDSVLAEGVPAVKELHKLEFELGPDKGPLGLPKLWELLPGLHNLQHLDLENSKIGDTGVEILVDALASLSSLEVLNLSQNSIGDDGVKKLVSTLKDLPKLHCLSLYSNVISDEGAESLAAVLPHMSSLTDLDVKYNKLTDVGAQSLGASLRACPKMKTLRMWNQCMPYGAFERLHQQDMRILYH